MTGLFCFISHMLKEAYYLVLIFSRRGGQALQATKLLLNTILISLQPRSQLSEFSR